MSWLLKQAEDILNRVDQQANATINQHGVRSQQSNDNTVIDSTTVNLPSKSTREGNLSTRTTTGTRRQKKNDDVDLIDYLNNSTPVNKSIRKTTSNNLLSESARTASTPNLIADEASESTELTSSKSATVTPRSITPAVSFHVDENDTNEDLVLVSSNATNTIDFNLFGFSRMCPR